MESTTGKKKIFELKKWNAVAIWSWLTEIENCAICKIHLINNCPICQNKEGNIECNPVWGICDHPYHIHCIERWLESKETCPLCQGKWQVKKST